MNPFPLIVIKVSEFTGPYRGTTDSTIGWYENYPVLDILGSWLPFTFMSSWQLDRISSS